MRLTVGSASDVGQVRSLNEDSLLVADDLFAVADGMGGHRGGEVASARALVAFQSAATERTLVSLMAAVQAANTDVMDHARSTPDLAGMGTTLCALAPLDDHRVAIVNVGDSRVYLLRGGALHQVSEDHSFVETLVREGRLTRAQADVHPQRNVITRALGIEPHIDVDGWEAEVRNGDRFLLCSDGLFNEVTDAEIEALLVETADPVEAAGRLIDAANAGGGRDNVTCVVVDVSDVDRADPPGVLGRPIADSLTRMSSAADLDATTVDQPTVSGSDVATRADGAAVGTAASASASAEPARRGRPGWRTVAFVAAILATFGVVIVATTWFYDNTYSVGAEDGRVVIIRGPNDNFLWFEPEFIRTDAVLDGLGTADRTAVRNGVGDLSLAEARNYVEALIERNTTTTSTTTTTTSTTTTVVATETAPSSP